MLKKAAINKIFFTTLTMIIVLSLYTIPATINKNRTTLRTNLEIEDVTGLKSNKIYLENENHFLVETEVFLGESTLEEQIKKIIDYLTVNNSKIPKGLNGYIPKEGQLKSIKIEEETITLNFEKGLIQEDEEKEKRMITGIVYSILELEKDYKVSIQVEEKDYKDYQNLTKKIGINKEYLLKNRESIHKVVIYYLDEINNGYYYVPVTEYVNDNRNKIEIIVEELSKSNHKGLISMVDENLELLNYREEANALFLNFNEKLQNPNKESEKRALEAIAYSVFENYDVNMVLFEVENKEFDYILR